MSIFSDSRSIRDVRGITATFCCTSHRRQVRPRSSQVPNQMAGILAPLASTNGIAATQADRARIMFPEHRLRILPPASSGSDQAMEASLLQLTSTAEMQ